MSASAVFFKIIHELLPTRHPPDLVAGGGREFVLKVSLVEKLDFADKFGAFGERIVVFKFDFPFEREANEKLHVPVAARPQIRVSLTSKNRTRLAEA